MDRKKLWIIDFGSQYTLLIARRLREEQIYNEIKPWKDLKDLDEKVQGLILSGGPTRVEFDFSKFSSLPMLGICLGAQMLAAQEGAEILSDTFREFGQTTIWEETCGKSTVWMSHFDSLGSHPALRCTAINDEGRMVAFQVIGKPRWGVLFHPEVSHTEEHVSKHIWRSFASACGCERDWVPETMLNACLRTLEPLRDQPVIVATSGGLDSTVTALLVRQVTSCLRCILIDTHLLRKKEAKDIQANLAVLDLPLEIWDENFLPILEGVTDPEEKRKRIGKKFIQTFRRAISGSSTSEVPLGTYERISEGKTEEGWLAQGTLYPDVIESTSIKSHHNVGGLPKKLKLKLAEPLRFLFKDEVRKLGEYLHVPSSILGRHPFPGPGLAIRILGEVTEEKVRKLQEADAIFQQFLISEHCYDAMWQAGLVLLPVRTVGVMGDRRTYEYVVAIRAVNSVDGMTAKVYPFTIDQLTTLSDRIIRSVTGINRVVYDVTSKPPGTIEWE